MGVAVSCCLSATGIRFSGHPVPPGSWAFLTVGLPNHERSGPGRGFHVPHTRDTTGVGASYAPRTTMLTRPSTPLRPAPAASQRPVPKPCSRNPPTGNMDNEVSTEVHAIHPSGLPLACSPRMEREPLGFPPSSGPRRCQRRPSGWGQAMSTRPELRCRHQSTLPSSSSLAVCDLMSHV
jgi:hypothetical protein